MKLEHYLFFLSTSILVLTSGIYGVKFLKKRNYLLGVEWLIVTFSATNFLVFALGEIQGAYTVSFFCDAFSRAFGIPVITTLGLMAVTHGYRPQVRVDVLLFAAAIAGTAVLVAAEAVAPYKAVFYVTMWTLFSLYLAYFICRLAAVRAYRHALAVSLVLAACQGIASIYDFYRIPGDDEQYIFYILAGLSWSSLCVVLYYAYGALERAGKHAVQQDHPLRKLEQFS